MTPLQQAAQAVIDRWGGPIPMPTATLIAELRKALDAELQQAVEPEVLMVDAAMVEMKNIVPPLRRSECLRLIRAAINATAHPPQPEAAYGWLEAVDKELVCTHLGIANLSDTFDEANAKLLALINWHVAVALDPSVNGGLSLQPQATTPSIRQHCSECANWAKAVADTKEWADGVKIGREIIKKLAAAQGEEP